MTAKTQSSSEQSAAPASRRIAKNLRSIRKTRNISQSQLAKASGLPKSTINHIETGESSPSVDSVEKLASALGVSIEELLSTPAAIVDVREPGELPVVREVAGNGRITRLLPDPFPGLDLYVLDIEPGGTLSGVVQGQRGRKFAYGLTGSVQLQIGGQSYVLKKGGTAVFPGDETHSFRNTGHGKASILKIHFYAEASMRTHVLQPSQSLNEQ